MPEPDTQKLAVVTGASSGIGRWIALGLARQGYHLVLIARNQIRGGAAAGWIANQHAAARIEIVPADLSLLNATRVAAQDIAGRHKKIDLLINNAGCFAAERRLTSESRDLVLATNHLSPFILARSLQPALLASPAGRIVTIGSSTSDRTTIDPDDLELRRGWGRTKAYSRSKLALMIASFTQARRLQGTQTVCNVVHPGAVATGLVREPGIIGLAWRVMAPFLLTEEQGADSPLHAALDPCWAGVTGAYIKRRQPVAPNRLANDLALAARVEAATQTLIADTTGSPID